MKNFIDIFPQLNEPFFMGSDIHSTGTSVCFRESGLELIVYDKGSICNRFLIDPPKASEILSGFNPHAFFIWKK